MLLTRGNAANRSENQPQHDEFGINRVAAWGGNSAEVYDDGAGPGQAVSRSTATTGRSVQAVTRL
jgi:hypothetical protein